MSITSKPFDWAQKLKFFKFLPRPAVYAHEDINKFNTAITSFVEKLSDALGFILQGDVTASYEPGTSGYNVEFVVPVNTYVYAKGVRFSVPAGTYSYANQEGDVTLYLIAKKTVKDFSASNSLAGITDGVVTVPSGEATIYENERLATAVSLGSGEEVICVLAKFTNDTI